MKSSPVVGVLTRAGNMHSSLNGDRHWPKEVIQATAI
jgi:hypothetical protein